MIKLIKTFYAFKCLLTFISLLNIFYLSVIFNSWLKRIAFIQQQPMCKKKKKKKKKKWKVLFFFCQLFKD